MEWTGILHGVIDTVIYSVLGIILMELMMMGEVAFSQLMFGNYSKKLTDALKK